MGWELLAGLVGAFAYYVTRYEKNYRGLYEKTLNFVEYLQWEWLALLKGVCGFVLLWRFGLTPQTRLSWYWEGFLTRSPA